MSKIVKFVCATDDGINFSKKHFGSAKKYLLYSLDIETGFIKYIKEINNTTPEERIHGDPKKAKSISQMLNNVQILIGAAFGPNIVRMRKKYVIVVSREPNIKKSLEKINTILEDIKLSLDQIGDKKIIYLR